MTRKNVCGVHSELKYHAPIWLNQGNFILEFPVFLCSTLLLYDFYIQRQTRRKQCRSGTPETNQLMLSRKAEYSLDQSISLNIEIGLNQTLQLIIAKLERRAQNTILQQQFLHITTPLLLYMNVFVKIVENMLFCQLNKR